MSTTNNAVLFVVGANLQGMVTGELVAGPAAAQSTATRMNSPVTHVLKAVSTGSFQLPSILNGEANELFWLVNDSGQTVNVYPASGEKTNGSSNAAFQVTANNTGIFVPVLNSVNNYPSTLDWRCVLLS